MANIIERPARKVAYFEKVFTLCENYNRVLIVEADNVGSRHLAQIRLELRGKAVILMGKNAMKRTALQQLIEDKPQLEKLIPLVKKNVGLVFCLADPAEVRTFILSSRLTTGARLGAIAPNDVVVPAGLTSLDPRDTSFFQALGIATKVTKGQIEILSQVDLIKKGDKVTASQAALLQKLNIKPFTYGLLVGHIYDDGCVYDAAVLDMTDQDVISRFQSGVARLAAFSREVGLPNEASVPHSLVQGFKHCAAFVLESTFRFPQMEKLAEAVQAATAAA